MSESLGHKILTKALYYEAKNFFDADQAKNLAFYPSEIYGDLRDTPRVLQNGHKPDILVETVLQNKINNITLIGEAKTMGDIKNMHTFEQIKTYLRYLNEQGGNRYLWFSVPSYHGSKILSMLRRVQNQMNVNLPNVTVFEYHLHKNSYTQTGKRNV